MSELQEAFASGFRNAHDPQDWTPVIEQVAARMGIALPGADTGVGLILRAMLSARIQVEMSASAALQKIPGTAEEHAESALRDWALLKDRMD